MNSCPHCEAPLKPAATFCLACDKPVVPETSRLSVGDPVHVSVGRPVVALLVTAGCLLALGGATYGAIAFVHRQHARSTAAIVNDVERGTTLLVDAEGGASSACRRTVGVLAGTPADTLRACLAIVGDDPGARVASVHVDRLVLDGTKGSARVRATVSDRSGARTVDHVVLLVHGGRTWRMSWDGRPAV